MEDYSEGVTPMDRDEDHKSHVEEAPQVKRVKELPELKKMRDRANDHWTPIMEDSRENTDFAFGEQWSGSDIQTRKAAGRPSFVYNLIPAFTRTVTNTARQAPPSVKIHPVGDGATKEAAKALSGLIAGIEYESNAASAYTYALECAVKGGIGSWRVNMFERDDQSIGLRIDSIADPTTVMWDPAARRPDFSDARFVVYEKMLNVDAACEMWEKYAEELKTAKDENDEVLVSELWAREEGGKIIQYVFTDDCLLDVNDEYPGSILPFVTVTGERGFREGRLHFHGLVRDIASVQREYNYLKSEAIASIANHPKAMAIAEENSVENHMDDWATANRVAKVMLFKKKGSELTLIPPAEPPVGYMQLADANVQVMKMITGIYAPSTGEHVDASSGKALKYEQAQGAVSTFHFLDSLRYGIKRCGEILIDIMPKTWIDDAVRVAIHPDGKTESVSVGPTQLPEVANLDLSYGKYGVTVSSGPAYASQREELQSRMMDFMKMNPASAAIIGPWLLQSIDLPGSESVADALISMLPPNVQQILSAQDDPMNTVRMQSQQIQQMQAQLQQMQQALQEGNAEKVKAQTQMQMKQMELEAQRQMTEMKIAHEKDSQQVDLTAKTMMRDADSHDQHTRDEAKARSQRTHEAELLGLNHARDDARERAQAQAANQANIQSLLQGLE